jgi:succinate dehydrogenase flavin-adding protein (antitoxin of CptAB toxin-antitoxin module)
MESELTEFTRLLEFTDKEFKLKLIMHQKDKELNR